ncbi:putative myristoylated membrane protein [Medusavirus stheno T3]|uniref:Myristoylated membrane protein n=1 Tax=Medusavirus stheno T3 TaxID=3069717 RepID=A0A7S7YET6_9VIRU|nr:putative myristoylated membrane protein [Acanthamoeba castellanii medusavirus]QPB44491.1 putative myristoylated membrane protein [Medusavirus stheno T3]
MGIAQSSNYVDQHINDAITSINSAVQTTRQESSAGQQIVVDDQCGNKDIFISHNNFKIDGTYSISGAQKAASSNNVKSQVDASMKQLADSVEGALGVGWASANNVTKLTEDIAVSLKNETTLNCIASQAVNQGIWVRTGGACADKTVVDVTYNDFDQTSNAMVNCMQDVMDSNYTVQTLKSKIDQTASATVEGLLGPFMLIIIVLILIVGGGMMGGEKMLTSPAFIVLLVIVILIYGIYAWTRSPKWFPFGA